MMQAAILPIIDANKENYYPLRDLAYGCDSRPPDGGFSFIVSVDYIKTVAEDTKDEFFIGLYKKFKKYPFVLVKCAGDEFIIQDL